MTDVKLETNPPNIIITTSEFSFGTPVVIIQKIEEKNPIVIVADKIIGTLSLISISRLRAESLSALSA